jgi:anti-sigma regulatory factor (Ser/Thr protein kinase)
MPAMIRSYPAPLGAADEVKSGVRFDVVRMVPASLESLESTTLEVRGMLSPVCSRTDVFAAELLLREALTNSVCHACGLDPKRLVSVSLRVREDRLVIVVRDDGHGFDWKRRLTHTPLDDDTAGRGLLIYQAYADQVRFNRTGNQLALVRRFRCPAEES